MRFFTFVKNQQTDNLDKLAFKKWIESNKFFSKPDADVSQVTAFLHHYKASEQVIKGFKVYKIEYEKIDLITILKISRNCSLAVWGCALLNLGISTINGHPFYPNSINIILLISATILFTISGVIATNTKTIKEDPFDYFEGIPLTPFFKNISVYLLIPLLVALAVLMLAILCSKYQAYSYSINTLLITSLSVIIARQAQEWL